MHAKKLKDTTGQTASKPVLLCKVERTLIYENPENRTETPNTHLINILNRAIKNGFDVHLYTDSTDEGTWRYSERTLRQTNKLPSFVFEQVRSTRDIEPSTYQNVIAIIDDAKEAPHIQAVKTKNPGAVHFQLDEIKDLNRQLQIYKPQAHRR